MLKQYIKNILRPVYHTWLWGVPKGYIFMLHRVGARDWNKLPANENMKVSPEFLESFLLQFKDEYDFIPLADVPARLCQRDGKKFMVMTFDDGYKDNLTAALPSFKKYNVPFTIFVATDFPDGKQILWWYELEDLILQKDKIVLSDGKEFDCTNQQNKQNSFMEIRRIILGLNPDDLENELKKLFALYPVDWTQKCKELSMSWDEIRACKEEPLITIGCHTVHHKNLKALSSAEEVRREVLEGRRILKEKAGIDSNVFSYPFGQTNEVGQREINVLSGLNMELAVLADGGYCGKKNTKSLFALPRIILKEDFTKEKLQ